MPLMQRVLVSACLLGDPVRWDARSKALLDPRLERWRQEGRLVPVCPELSGGLGVPRPPAERVGLRVLTRDGRDVTSGFVAGAGHALETARRFELRLALLKKRSPSCGSGEIYDGTFSGRVVAGDGVTSELLRANGVEVFDETQLDALELRLEALEAG